MSDFGYIQTATEIEYKRAHAKHHLDVLNKLSVFAATSFLITFVSGIVLVILHDKSYAMAFFGVSLVAMLSTFIIFKVSEPYSIKLDDYEKLSKSQLLELYKTIQPYPDLKKTLAAMLKRGFVISKESYELKDAVYDLNSAALQNGIEDSWSEKLAELNSLVETK